ncbi:hypothetical protein ADL03_43215 [Nocardia sp. NRRL S-836]|nr:hypothetical protein ADL03_43215 [Nocardia sp. NRRL S-836]
MPLEQVQVRAGVHAALSAFLAAFAAFFAAFFLALSRSLSRCGTGQRLHRGVDLQHFFLSFLPTGCTPLPPVSLE